MNTTILWIWAFVGPIATWLVCANNAKRAIAVRDAARAKAEELAAKARKSDTPAS